jgi:DNA primase
VVLVEGMFDVAALWQAGFGAVTCGWGAHLNHLQYEQLARGERTVWIAFDGDAAGQSAARDLTQRLRSDGRTVLRAALPDGHDPASYLAGGAAAADFQRLLDEARP